MQNTGSQDNSGDVLMLPRMINLGSGKSFSQDSLNIDINEFWQPDIVADLSASGSLDLTYSSNRFGDFRFPLGYFERIQANDVLEHVRDLTTMMKHCLDLLREGGEFSILVPYDLSYGAWQDPTHVRAFNERSWLYYTDWFWYLGWQDSRFDVVNLSMVLSPYGLQLQAGGMPLQTLLLQPRAVDSMQVSLRKRNLTAEEQSVVRKYLTRPVNFGSNVSSV